jgi:WD40 repeat protein
MRLRSSTVASKKRTAEEASLSDEDAPRECADTAPAIPVNLISHLIVPFLQDRFTWNAVFSANKELHEAGTRMTPPWPATKLGQSVGALKFSPCGSFLAYGTRSSPYLVHICDRRGRQTCLRGHTAGIFFLSFSKDGNYLASVGDSHADTSIRIWPTNSTTRLPQQADKTLRGHQRGITCLDFSPHDSNILASGEYCTIKLWNVEQEVCIYSFDHTIGSSLSLYFPVQDEGQKCIFVTGSGALIRTSWQNNFSDIESAIVDIPGMEGLGGMRTSAFSHCGSLLAAAHPGSCIFTLYDTRTVNVVRRISLPRNMSLGLFNCLAFSPDGKTLVLRSNTTDEIQIREVPDLNLLRRLVLPDAASVYTSIGAVAFDPSGQFLASAGVDQIVRLWTL